MKSVVLLGFPRVITIKIFHNPDGLDTNKQRKVSKKQKQKYSS